MLCGVAGYDHVERQGAQDSALRAGAWVSRLNGNDRPDQVLETCRSYYEEVEAPVIYSEPKDHNIGYNKLAVAELTRYNNIRLRSR